MWGGKNKGSLQADHLDNDKSNNSASNLVPSCHGCNVHRDRVEPQLIFEVFAGCWDG